MNIIGISPLDKDATVTLLTDGRIEYAIAEERLSRKKMHAGFPYQALELMLQQTGLSSNDVDHVVYAFFDWEKETELMNRNRERDYQFNRAHGVPMSRLVREAVGRVGTYQDAIPGLGDTAEKMVKPWWKTACYRLATREGLLGDWTNHRQLKQWLTYSSEEHHTYHDQLLDGLREFGLADKLERIEHHQTHVSNAFYCSGFERALVLTVDAYGSGLSGCVSVADDSGVRRLSEIETPYSLGRMYEMVTSALGYSPDRHAGKIVGLAAYGDPEVAGPILREMFEWDNGAFRIRRSSDVYLSRLLSTLIPKIDVAAAYQTVLEEVVARQVRYWVDQTGIDTIVMSGGVAANVKMNQRVHEVKGVRNIYIHPGMGDGGCSIGAAVHKARELGIHTPQLESVYLGPDYSAEEIEAALKSADVEYGHFDDVESEIARLVAEDNVVARFNGRMEYGPRALGNRSILYPAHDPAVNQWLNTRLGRTEFMPFAPATIYEDRHECYKNMDGAEFTSLFMTITFDCTESMRKACPAAIHIDGTARPQLVSAESNPSFYRILEKYKERTGISSIINTSFNMHEEPIVCTPQDAIRAFQRGRLDYLAIGNYVVASDEKMSAAASQAQVPAH